jgi:hypothetical protein
VIQFAVVIGDSSSAVRRFSRGLASGFDRARLFDGEHLESIDIGGKWAVMANSTPDPICSARLSTDDQSMVVINGNSFVADADPAEPTRHVLRGFASGGSPAVAAAVHGAYNFVGVDPSRGLRAFTDFSGLYPLYWHQGDDVAVVTNRSTIMTGVGSRDWDPRALAWIIGHANLFGDRMPVDGVSYLPPGYGLRGEAGGSRLRVEQSTEYLWPPPGEGPLRDNLSPPEWDDVTEALVTNFRALPEHDVQLWLSGGKDSRLCLALAKAAGLQGSLPCLTYGASESPEVECAAAVAEVAGFRHALGVGPLAKAAVDRESTPDDRRKRQWRRLRQHLHRFEAIVCPRDGNPDSTSTTTLSIQGIGGELYRGPGGHAKQFNRRFPTTLDEMATMFVNYHQRHDPLGVLRPAEVAFQVDWLKTWVYDNGTRVRMDLLPEKFYVDYRLGHWNGPLGQGAPADVKLYPLASREVFMKYMELSPRARASDRLHFEVMRRTAPELIGVPLLNDVWAPDLAEGTTIELPTQPFPSRAPVSARTLRPGRWRFLESERDAIEQLFADAEHATDMGSICDMAKLGAVLRAPSELGNIEMKELESAILVALALLGRAELVLDRP